MKQWKFKGFTLIELLIVVAIIAILAAIAVPNFLEAQIRSKVSRSKNDMRSIATALEAYFVDNNTYVAHSTGTDSKPPTVNSGLKKSNATAKGDDGGDSPVGAWYRYSWQIYRPDKQDGRGYSITTPVAFMSSVPSDPFADTRAASFGYYNALDAGWIMWSYGPDTDENINITTGNPKGGNGQIQIGLWNKAVTAQSVYNPYNTNPSIELMVGSAGAAGTANTAGAYSYDATNGSTSKGDVWRVKQ